MKPTFILFVVVIILGFVAGFYYHEALNEKVQYERDSCYDMMKNQNGWRTFEKTHNYSEVIIYGTEK